MVSFRKSLLLMALLVVVAGLASAQVTQPLTCVANSGATPPLRAEGLAEEVGQVVIECTGGQRAIEGTLLPTVNVQVFLNTNLTSRLYNTGSEALLLVDNPSPTAQLLCPSVDTGCAARASYAGGDHFSGTELTYGGNAYTTASTTYQGYNVFRAKHASQIPGQQFMETSATFLGVPFNPPGTAGTRALRIVNIRANANQLSGIVGGFGLPSAVQMVISISGTAALPLASTALTVGFVQPGLHVTIGDRMFNQCDRPGGTGTNSASTDAIPVAAFSSYYFDVNFSERFGTAFRRRGTATQNIVSGIYNTESMFSNSSFGNAGSGDLPTFGYASQGTRLRVRFEGIPTGVRLLAIPYPVPDAPTTRPASTITLAASSGFVSGTSNTRVDISGQAGTAIFEVTGENPNEIENIDVRVYVWWSTTPGMGTATVRGTYAPTSTAGSATGSTTVPRFVDSPTNQGSFTITPCQTNLLFPYITNQAGFDTGLVVSNTSLDPYGTVPQEGPCKLYYYGKSAAGATMNEVVDTATVKAGEQQIWLLSAANPGFQGYLIARCNFQYAHGFAFVSDLGAQKLAMGYLALVLDAQKSYRDRATRTAVVSETLGQ